MATGSSRKSFFSPTSMIGTPGHFSVASSTHYSKLVSIDNVLHPAGIRNEEVKIGHEGGVV